MKYFVKHLNHYIPLIGILSIALVGVVSFSTDIKFQQVIVIAASAAYVAWGIMYHIAHKDLSLSILLEYVAVALLGTVIVFSILRV